MFSLFHWMMAVDTRYGVWGINTMCTLMGRYQSMIRGWLVLFVLQASAEDPPAYLCMRKCTIEV